MKKFWQMIQDESLSKDEANQQRASSIDVIADAKSSDIFLVTIDDNLGAPF